MPTEVKKISPQDEVCMALTAAEPTFKMSLPPQIPSTKFIRVAQTAIRQTPALAGLDRQSLYAAFHKCAADGLLPDGREAAIVPFGQTATYMPMIQGICKKARNSGEIKTINAQIVYKNDAYEHWIDESGEHFKHVPTREEKGEAILAYAGYCF
jgi:recombination protein RecT